MNPRQCVCTQLFLVFYSTDTTALRPGCFILLSGFRSALQGIPPIGTRVVDVLHITVENKKERKRKNKKKAPSQWRTKDAWGSGANNIYKRAPAVCSGAPACRKGTGGSPLEGALLCFTIQVGTPVIFFLHMRVLQTWTHGNKGLSLHSLNDLVENTAPQMFFSSRPS